MSVDVAALTTENQRLRDELARERQANHQLGDERRELAIKLEATADELARFKALFFRRASEKLSGEERLQMRLFDEVEQALDEDHQPVEDQNAATQVPAHSRRRPARRPLPESLLREEVLIDIAEQDKQCNCGHQLVRIGEEVAERLDVIPPRLKVLRTVRPKYACHHCEGSGDEERPAVRIAPAPPTLIPKGIATPGLLAFIATAKFCDALPLYPQQRHFARIGVELPRCTMADWMMASAAACRPVEERCLRWQKRQ